MIPNSIFQLKFSLIDEMEKPFTKEDYFVAHTLRQHTLRLYYSVPKFLYKI